MIKLVRRPAQLTDSDTLLAWRNDPLTRQHSLAHSEIAPEEHIRWFTQKLRSPEVFIWIYEQNGIPVGTVRLEWGEDRWYLSWTVSPLHRGKGIGKLMLQDAVQWADRTCYAKIKPDNLPSTSIAQKTGFSLWSSNEEFQIWKFEPEPETH